MAAVAAGRAARLEAHYAYARSGFVLPHIVWKGLQQIPATSNVGIVPEVGSLGCLVL